MYLPKNTLEGGERAIDFIFKEDALDTVTGYKRGILATRKSDAKNGSLSKLFDTRHCS